MGDAPEQFISENQSLRLDSGGYAGAGAGDLSPTGPRVTFTMEPLPLVKRFGGEVREA
jgi:hypothetical protein